MGRGNSSATGDLNVETATVSEDDEFGGLNDGLIG